MKTLFSPSIHFFIFLFCFYARAYPKLLQGKIQGTPRTGRQVVAGLVQLDRQPFILNSHLQPIYIQLT